ncbi:hypothetical protein UFOVP601_30 [uncultured Caudovirales phage]|uniref:Uncharacterized protein n=1 Tax=uncultured Caudovirales phage TaxID=2100421 RepID=A0A6J5MYR3_9CAUD|nr:hypothetical protein UFOVP601_30 [uncultured Caudovirales phage]
MKTEIHDGKTYTIATYRGTEYTLTKFHDGWFVRTRRIALGRWNAGGGKHYATLAAVANGCKAFGSEADIARSVYGFDVYESISI